MNFSYFSDKQKALILLFGLVILLLIFVLSQRAIVKLSNEPVPRDQIDKAARLQILQELGHNRIEITNYLTHHLPFK
jgi:hypothetical protein